MIEITATFAKDRIFHPYQETFKDVLDASLLSNPKFRRYLFILEMHLNMAQRRLFLENADIWAEILCSPFWPPFIDASPRSPPLLTSNIHNTPWEEGTHRDSVVLSLQVEIKSFINFGTGCS